MEKYSTFISTKFRFWAVMPAILLLGLFLCPYHSKTVPHPRNTVVMAVLSPVTDFVNGKEGTVFLMPSIDKKRYYMVYLQIPLNADIYQSQEDCLQIMHANATAIFAKLEGDGILNEDPDLQAYATIYYEANDMLHTLQRQLQPAPMA